MGMEIPVVPFPEEVEISSALLVEEQPKILISKNRSSKVESSGDAFHDKSEKNKKTNQGGSYRREIAAKYKKPKTRGDKKINMSKKKKPF